MRKGVISKDDLQCIKFLSGIRWKHGPICTACGKKNVSKLIQTRGLFQCNECRKQFGVLTGTRFEGTRLSPYNLVEGILTFHKLSVKGYNGYVKVREFERELGWNSYSTIQRLHKKLQPDLIKMRLSLEMWLARILK